MTNKDNTLIRIPTLNGRRVQQLKKDAKRKKKKLDISLQEALNLTVKEHGLSLSWQRLVTRGTELFGKLSGTPYEAPLAKSTLFMGHTGSNMSRIATNQWARSLSNDPSVIDVFIDAHGDTLTYATVASRKQITPGISKLNLFSPHGTTTTKISNLFSCTEKTLRCLVNALFDSVADQHAAVAYLQGADAPEHVVDRVEKSKEFGILMWMDEFYGEKGLTLDKALGFCNSTLFLLPLLNKAEIDNRVMLTEVLKLCMEAVHYDKRAALPMRITITGLGGQEPIPATLIEKLMTHPNIQVIIQTELHAMSEWQDTAIQLAEQAYVSRVIDVNDVPESVKCIKERLKQLNSYPDKTPVLMFRQGNLVDVEMSLASEPAYLSDHIKPPTHRNGQPITIDGN